jgi:DNA-binding PadR family transcriptional regulator
MPRPAAEQLLLGEWACLGILYQGPTHGFAIAARLKPDGDIGRVWSVSRPLTYRSLEQLTLRGHVHPIGEERGIAGGNRTILAATRQGRAALRRWLATPVAHLRDLRSELLLKLVIAEQCGIDVTAMLAAQRERIVDVAGGLDARASAARRDVVALWRHESSIAALRFIDQLEPLVTGRDRG